MAGTNQTYDSEAVGPAIRAFCISKSKDFPSPQVMHEEYFARLLVPLEGLSDNSLIKAIIAALLTLVASDVQVVVLIAALVIMDLITGIVAALRRKEAIRSWGFRQTGIKTIEYMFLLTGCTMVANAFDIMSWLDTSAYFFVAVTELKSIIENVTSSEGAARKVWERLKREIQNRAEIDLDDQS
jgi:phage-related holin